MWPGPALLLLGLGLGLGLGSQPTPPGPRGLPGVLRGAPGLGQGMKSSVRDGGTGGLSPRSAPRRASLTLPRRCPSDAAARVLLKLNSSDPAAATAMVSCQMACIIQPLKINRKDPNAPLILSRGEEATLNVTVGWHCPDASVIRKSWEYFSVASVNDTPDWNRPVLLPQVQVTKVSSLHIPKYALPYGVYVFNFTLSITRWDPVWPKVTGSDSIYIWVKKRPLKAVLPGDTRATVKFSDELILNGSMSYDPEADIPTEGLRFFWYCTTNPRYYSGNYVLVTQDVCHPEQETLNWPWAVGPILTVPPKTLRGNGVYYFRMVVQKQNRTAFSDKTVHVLQGLQPKAHISCTENCGPTLAVSDRFSLFLNCSSCDSRDFYSWSILSGTGHEVMFDWAGQAITRRNGPYLSIKAFAFRNFLENRLWVFLTLKSWGGVTMTLRHPIVINHGPQVGKCKISPVSGISMVTEFAVECSGFKDENLPLKYKIIVSELDSIGEISSVEENTLGSIVYSGTEPITPVFFLPVGTVTDHYIVRLYAQVYDSLGTFSQVTLQATVKAPTVRDSSKNVLQQLLNVTMEPTSSLSTLLQKQDWLQAGYLIYVVTSVLNNIKGEPELQDDRAHLLEHLVNQSFVITMNTVDEIAQSVMVIIKLTQKASDLSQVLLEATILWLRQANQALQAYQRKHKHLHSQQIEIVSTGILTSLSNLLKMINPYHMLQDPLFVVESLSDTMLANKVPGSKTTALRTSNFNMYVEKVENWNALKVFRNESLCPNCLHATLNASLVPGLPPNAPISMMFCEFTDDPFPWLTYPENISTDVVGFRMTAAAHNGKIIEITPDTAEVYLVRKDLTLSSFNLTVGPAIKSDGFSKMTVGGISFEVDSGGIGELLIHIVTNVTVLFQALVYEGSQLTPTNLLATFLVPHDIPPIAKWSGLFDPTCSVKQARVICLSSSLLRSIAQRRHSFKYNISVALQASRFVFKPTNKLVRIALFRVHCLDMDGIQSDWQQSTCTLGEKTTWKIVHCICRNGRRSRRQLASMKRTYHRLHTHFVTAKKNPKVTLDKVAPQKHPLMSEEGLSWKQRLNKWHEYEMKALPSKAAMSTSAPKKKDFETSQKHEKADTQMSNKNFSNNNLVDSEDVPPKASSSQMHTTESVKKKTQIILPRWCVYIAWFLVFATSGISSFFIVFYGLTYGYKKSVEWLFASFCSFCQSVFLVQPCNILLRSGTRTQKPKYCKNLSWSSKYHYSEIRLHELKMTLEEMEELHEDMAYVRSLGMYQPISEDKIQILRRKNRIRRRSFLFLSYLVTHFIFLTLLLLLIFSLRHNDSFYYNQFIRHRFSMDLDTVMKLGDIYKWLSGVLLPLLHNDPNPTFLPDSSSKILGLPLMRQVRAKPSNKTCLLAKKFVQSSVAGEIRCHPQYGIDPEDTQHYSSVWNKAGKRSTDKASNGFTYKPLGKKWVYYSYGALNTYGSGGYAFYFFPEQQMFNSTVRLKELEGKNWLDELTWAVIVELTTLNPDTSLMCSISVVFEVSPLGVVNSSLSVYSFSLADFNRNTSAEIYLYTAILIFFCAYVVDEGYIIMQEKASYVKSVYNLLNLSLKCMFTLLIVLFFWKHLLATKMARFHLADPEAFTPFHAISRVDHFMRIILAFLLFLTILKTLRYSRFFYNVRLAQKAIQAALPGICHMALVVSMFSFMYVAFGYVVFGQHEWNYSNMIHATQTIFSYCVSAFQNTEFSGNKALGVLFLSSFMLVMICIFINLFQAVILSAYDEMKQPAYEEPSDEAEAVTYLCNRLKSGFDFLTSRFRDKDQSGFFVDMLYGQPEKNTRRFLGLKARNINGKKMIYLVV
ncbi:polycystic kidney disease and receptor for egg jelly-related protein isoform X2 [Mastomys coucha]|uniref:polycystic kidney disease and receptor for egg jelly-related protein isoform X2 n=1 Tax=Mastomys coucha TaxID=35658 RepID=UPI0012615F46|nr:polycystic kidney disease and receptor for egg jelly-related protein isoform X2 [Mastomys coucha]